MVGELKLSFKKTALAAAIAVGTNINGWAQEDNPVQIVVRDPRTVDVIRGQWTTVLAINPHDGFGRSYTTDSSGDLTPTKTQASDYTTEESCEARYHVWDANSPEEGGGTCKGQSDSERYDHGGTNCRRTEAQCRNYCEEAGYYWSDGICTEDDPDYNGPGYGEFSLLLTITGFTGLRPLRWGAERPFQVQNHDGYVRLRTRRFDHSNFDLDDEASYEDANMFGQEGNFIGTPVHALCKESDALYEEHAMACSKLPADWPPENRWPEHAKVQYWERTGGEPDTTYYVEGPFLVQVWVSDDAHGRPEGVVRAQYNGYTDVVGGGDRHRVIEYAEATVRTVDPY